MKFGNLLLNSVCYCGSIIQVSGDVPTFPWVRSRVWVGTELGLGLGPRVGWIETCIDPLSFT